MRESRGLMGLPAPSLGYDGMVMAGQQQIPVHDGVMRVGNRTLNVSQDGKVTDEQDRQVATVQNGQLVPMQQQQHQGAQ